MKHLSFFILAGLSLYCMSSCIVDKEVWVNFEVHNQCEDSVMMKLLRLPQSPDSTPFYSGLNSIHPDNSSIIIDHIHGTITIPPMAAVKYIDLYGGGRKDKIDVEANSHQSIKWIFTDSVTIIFSDGRSVLHTLNGTTANNILKRESYTRSGDTFTYYITEADHQAALSAGK